MYNFYKVPIKIYGVDSTVKDNPEYQNPNLRNGFSFSFWVFILLLLLTVILVVMTIVVYLMILGKIGKN